jgi:iron complex transport system substrate-binding protein
LSNYTSSNLRNTGSSLPRTALTRRSALGLLAGGAAVFAAPFRAGAEADLRIVSLGGAVTETLYALGCADAIAGVDLSSVYPPAARSKPNVGYYRRISAEGVLALSPSVVIAADGSGPKEAVEVLAAASVPLVALKEVRLPEDVAARIRVVAEAARAAERGAVLADGVAADLASLAAGTKAISKRRRTLVLLGNPQGGALMAGGRDTSAALALELAGAENAASAMSGWKPLVDEAAFGLDPEAIVVLATGAPIRPETIAANPAFARSAAVRENRVLVADALGLVGFGPRAAHAARAAAAAIYPERAFPALPVRPWVEPGATAL